MGSETMAVVEANRRTAIGTVLTAWLTAGTIDIIAASIYFPIAGGFRLIELYQGIASGIIGARAFSGGVPAAVLGLALHYLIALIWTVFYFLIYPVIRFSTGSRMAAAAEYGVLVSCIMTFVVLPLSNVHHYPVVFAHFIISTGILIFTIGLPITSMIRRYYSDHTA